MQNKITCIVLCLLLNVVAVNVMSEEAASDGTVEFQFATDPWPPFFLETPTKYIGAGVGYDLVIELFNYIPNVIPTFPKIPWKRALIEVETGSKDAIALLLKTDERSEYMVFTKPVMQTPALLFFNKKVFPSGFEWQDIREFEQYRIGFVRGYSYGEPLDSYIATKPKNVFGVTNSAQLFSMLQRQHIDLVPENAAVAYALANEQGWLDNLGAAEKKLSSDIMYIGISKKSSNVALVAKLNDAIDKMRISGEIDRLIGHIGSSIHPELID